MEHNNIEILLVDDEPDILEILEYNLSKEGYRIRTAQNGLEALEKAKNLTPHLVILDMMMPVMDGLETCKKLRELPEMEESIIAFLTALNEDVKEMESYQAGADDYITKPIRPKVLVSKVKALLRRFSAKEKSNILQRKNLLIDIDAYKIEQNGEKIHLPRKEFEILILLATVPEKVFSREEILKEVWGEDVIVGGRTVDVHIRKLREKLGADLIETVTGIGYKFMDDE